MIVNVIAIQHQRRPSTQISHKPVVLRYMVWGHFAWFCWWLYSIVQTIFRAKFQGNIAQYFRRTNKKIALSKIHRPELLHGNQQINVKQNETTK